MARGNINKHSLEVPMHIHLQVPAWKGFLLYNNFTIMYIKVVWNYLENLYKANQFTLKSHWKMASVYQTLDNKYTWILI